jgi:hypothetical protein
MIDTTAAQIKDEFFSQKSPIKIEIHSEFDVLLMAALARGEPLKFVEKYLGQIQTTPVVYKHLDVFMELDQVMFGLGERKDIFIQSGHEVFYTAFLGTRISVESPRCNRCLRILLRHKKERQEMYWDDCQIAVQAYDMLLEYSVRNGKKK